MAQLPELPELPEELRSISLTELKKEKLAQATELKRQVLGALKDQEPIPNSLAAREATRTASIIDGNRRFRERQGRIDEANANSVVSKLGLDHEGYPGMVINQLASFAKDAAALGGNVLQAPLDAYAFAEEASVDAAAKEAYGRYRTNQATDADMDLLSQREMTFGSAQMPAREGAANLDRLERALKARGFSEKIDQLSNWDSLAGMGETEERTNSLMRRATQDGTVTAVKGAVSVPEMAVGLADIVSGGHAGKTLEEAGFRPEEAREFLDTLKTWEQRYADENVGQAEGFWDTMEEIAANPSVVPHAVGESIPSMLAGGLFGRGLQALGAGSKVAAAAGEGLVMAGSAAEGIRQQTADGLLSLKQTAAAGGTGVMGSLVNRLSGGLANKAGLGDVDEALVKGALGTSTKPVVPRTVGAAGLEGGEEAVQSSGEQVLQNLALDRPYDEGVGNAAAMGLVTGTAMGSVMGGASREQKEALARYDDAQKAADKAAETGDVEALVNPESATYNPVLGARALMRHIEKADLAPEQKEAKSQELVSLVGDMQASLDKKKATLAEYAPERVQEMQAELDQRKTELAAVDPADTETVAEYTQYITALEKRVAVRSDADSRKRAKTAVETLETQLETARKFEQRVTGKVAETAQATIKQAIETPDTVEPTVLEKAVAESFTLSMRNPEALTDSTLDYLINSPSIKLDDAQRKHLRFLSASRVAENQLKDFGAVSDEIRLGSDKNKGMKQYRSWITSALNATTPDEVTARREIKDLQNFAASHIKKVTALKSALDAIQKKGGSVQVVPDAEGNWGPVTQPLSMKAMKEAGGFTVTRASAGRINEVRKEAAALKSLLNEMKSLYKLRTSSVKQAPAVVAPTEPVTVAETPRQEIAKPVAEPAQATVAEAPQEIPQPTSEPVQDPASVAEEVEANVPANFVEQAARVSDLDARERLLEGQKLLDANPQELDDDGETAAENLYTDMFNENSIREAFAPVRARIARLASPEFVQRMDAKIDELAADQDLAAEEAAGILQWMEGLADKQDDVQPDLFEEAVVDGRLKLFAEASGKPFEAANYLTQNRVAEDFEQVRHAKKPLTSVTDFMSKIKSGKAKFQSFIDSDLTDEQHGLLNRFVVAAEAWQDTLQGQLKRMKNKEGKILTESFAYDFMQFLHDDDLNLEENIATALSVSAYGWILEASGKPRLDNEEAVNAKIGRKQDLAVPPALMRLLSDVGTTRNLVVNRLGDMAIQALGLRLKKDAPSDSHDRLRIALGAHTLAMLEEQGIVEASTVSDKAVVDASRDKREYNAGNHVFIRLVTKNGELNQQAQSIVESARQTEGAFNKVFGVESAVQFPALTAPKMRPETHVKGLQKTPDLQWKILKKVAKRTSYLRADSMQVVTLLNPEVFEQVAGVVLVDETKVHKAHRKSQEAKNDGLRREIAHLMEFFQQISKLDASLDVPFHLTPTTSNNQRVMLKENGINPQTSKVHRFVTRMGGWVSNVSMGKGAGDTSLINFQLRVMEGLGIKSDEQSDEATLAKWESIENDPTYRAAAQAIRDLIWNETVTPESQEAILAGVLKGKEKMHSFDALLGLADYLQAKESGKQVFTSHMMGEVDGKTNGPMLSLWLLGAMTQNLAPKGGFMLKSMDEKGFGAWKALGNLDLYQTLASDMTFSMQEITKEWSDRDYSIGLGGIDALYRFTGVLRAEDGSVSKDARNLVKTPLTGLMYGSSVFTALDAMAEETLDRVYARMESLAAKKNKTPDSMEQIVRDINALLTLGMSKGKKMSSKQKYFLESQLLPETMTLEQGMEWEFSDKQASLFKGAFQVSLGKATRVSLQENLGDFMAARTQINNTLQAAYAIYDQMYALERGRYEEELMDAGLMAFKRNKDEVRVPLHDLTAEQTKVLRERVKAFEPRLHTASSQTGSTEGAVFATQSERHLNSDPRYSSQIAFNGRPRMQVRAMTEMMKDPGVSGMAKSVQSTDSFIAMSSYAQVEALNVHDALGLALKDMVKGANSLNKHTFEALLNYSIPEQTYQALERTVLALAERIETEGDAFDMDALRQIHVQIEKAFDKDVEGVPFDRLIPHVLDAAKYGAYAADQAKLNLLMEVDTLDQYTLEKGVYRVTDKDREAIEAKLKTLQPVLSAEVQAAAELLAEKAKGMQPGKAAEAQEEVVEEDDTQELSPLEAALKAKPVMPAKEVFGLVEQALLATPAGRVQNLNRKLLKMLANTVDAGLEIRYVTPNTPKSELKGEDVDNSLGWFTTEGGTPTIYLRSTDSQVGNLTPELVLHELVHGALAQTIEAELAARTANPEHESEALDLIDDLELLRVQAEAFIAKDAQLQQNYAPAIENVHELISWGMTNQGFQRDVLNKMTFESQRKGPNGLIKAMRKFIDSVVGILFNGSSKTEKEQAASALTALITNTSGLFYEAGVTRNQQAGLTLRQRATSQAAMDTLQVFDSLAQANKPMSQDQTARLQALVSGVMSRLQGPFGVLKAQMQSTQATDPIAQIMQAKVLGILPFSADTATAGIGLNEQETFALELAQLTFQETLDSAEAQGTRKQLVRLYEEARRNPNIRTALNTQQWDHVFNSKGQGSEYLARFAALAMVWEPLHDQMSFETDKDTRKVSQMKLGERIQWLWEQLLDALQHRLFKVYSGQQADEKLSVLARRLVDLEYRKQNRRTGPVGAAREQLEDALDGVSTKAKQQVLRVLESPMLDQHKNAFVRAASSIAAASVDDQVGQLVDAGKVLRDRLYQGKLGLMAGVINEMREGNKVADLLLLSTKFLETVRMKIKTDFAKMSLDSFAENGEYLTQRMKDAVTKVALRTDMQSLLGPFDSAGLLDLMTDKAARDKAIAQYEAQLSGPFKDAYIQGVKQLAYRMAVKVKGYNTQQNALGIALRLNTPDSTKVSLEEGREIAKVLDPLVSLYALEYTDANQRMQAAQVMRKELERDDKGNGIEVILKLHRHMQKESAEKLFKDSELLMMKGYLPEVYNPHTEIITAPASEVARMVAQGYEVVGPLEQDDTDVVLKDLVLLRLTDRGLPNRQTGVVTYTGQHHKGTEVHAPLYSRNGYVDKHAARINRAITRAVQAQPIDPNYDPRKDSKVYMAPVINAVGEAAGYRYLMSEQMKDQLLERNNSFDLLLGALESNIFDKSNVTQQNRKAFEALKDQYDQEYTKNPDAYITFGPDSKDASIRETWRILPPASKQALRDVWGSDNLMVRNDIYDQTFGYSAYSLSKIMELDEAQRNFSEDMFFKMTDLMVRWQLKREGHTGVDLEDRAKRAALMIRRGEDRWMEVIRVVKDILVVKTGMTLLWNVVSNYTQLWLSGVPVVDIAKNSWVALQGVLDYRKDESELSALQAQLASGAVVGDVREMQQKILRLENTLAKSPVRSLIEAGLLSSIVEDVDTADSDYSYKSRWVKSLEQHADRVPDALKSVAKVAFVTHDTALYRVLSQGTQVSDFVARYTLYQQLISRKKNPLSHEDAVLKVSRAFVNYDKPSHQLLDYANRMGLVYFTKYYLRIQHVIMDLMKENPARALMLLAFDGYLDGAQTLIDSAAVNQFGNPLDIGAFKMLDAWDETLPIQAISSLIK